MDALARGRHLGSKLDVFPRCGTACRTCLAKRGQRKFAVSHIGVLETTVKSRVKTEKKKEKESLIVVHFYGHNVSIHPVRSICAQRRSPGTREREGRSKRRSQEETKQKEK